MFQLLRRVSTVFLPRPDRPWSDDATSNPPMIGRKRTHSVTEEDDDESATPTKRTKNGQAHPETERDSPSAEESPKADADTHSLAEGRGVKQVTKGVKEVDLEDDAAPKDAPPLRPEGVPLPDSPSGSPEAESELGDTVPSKRVEAEESQDAEHTDVEDDRDSLASSAPEDILAKEPELEADALSSIADTSADKITPAQRITIAVRSSDLLDTPEALEVKA